MSLPPSLNIDLNENFPHLPLAPIVEAVIEIRARAQTQWDESAIRAQVEVRVPDYPNIDSQREFEGEVRVEAGQRPQQIMRDLGWKGLRCRSADQHHIAQFNRDSFVFSRLKPYDRWDQFQRDALRLWEVHLELARPAEAYRLGVRFINRIGLPPHGARLEDYLQVYPDSPRNLDLPFTGFFHRDELAVPGHPYAINIVRTIQPAPAGTNEDAGLILDIDVFTTQPFEPGRDILTARLSEMRWLKNRVFFGSIKEQVRVTFQ